MANLRRNRATAMDGATPRFLYTILKQLDLKSVDWNRVAANLDITNGHAARMRFSRFKQQMEGLQPPARKQKSAVTDNKKPGVENLPSKQKLKDKPEKRSQEEDFQPMETEASVIVNDPDNEHSSEISAKVKPEYVDKGEEIAGSMAWAHVDPNQHPYHVPKSEDQWLDPLPDYMMVKEEPEVKVEDEANN